VTEPTRLRAPAAPASVPAEPGRRIPQLPTLAVLGLKARDIMGDTFTMFLVLFPVVLVLVALLAPHVTP
jgi:hypothetical protein